MYFNLDKLVAGKDGILESGDISSVLDFDILQVI